MGQFKIKTDKIQEMISKSVKGAGNNIAHNLSY